MCKLLTLGGLVRLNDADVTAIAGFLKIGEYEVAQHYTRLWPKRDGLALIDKPNGKCILLEGIDCAIQPVKPHQGTFPRHGRMQKTDRQIWKNMPLRNGTQVI